MSYEDFAGPRRLPPPLLLLILLLGVALTVLSQYGGILLWLCVPLIGKVLGRLFESGARLAGWLFGALLFFVIYVVVTFLVVPAVAPLAGRVALPCSTGSDAPLQPATKWSCFFSRRYVRPALAEKAEALAAAMDERYAGQITYYLDAGFPFFDRFPLWPHLTHKDGRKLDFAFAYVTEVSGRMVMAAPPSAFGYFKFEPPGAEDEQPCKGKRSSLRWDMAWLQDGYADYKLDEEKTKAMLAWLLADETGAPVKRIFLEPHLKARFGLEDERVRFQGCKAARHDDHFHVEI